MKKVIGIAAIILLAFILCFAVYSFIWGGKPQTESFDKLSADYECIAKFSLEYYDSHASTDEHITLFTYDDHIEDFTNNSTIDLTDEQKSAIKSVNQNFGGGCLWATDNSVVFWQDETKYYGLVYSKHPLSAVWSMKSNWYRNLEYHRINGNWYEIGAFGI